MVVVFHKIGTGLKGWQSFGRCMDMSQSHFTTSGILDILAMVTQRPIRGKKGLKLSNMKNRLTKKVINAMQNGSFILQVKRKHGVTTRTKAPCYKTLSIYR